MFVISLERSKLKTSIASTAFYKRYVDDTLLVCSSKSEAEKLLADFNTVHQNIKFTSEHEENNQLSFLDVLMHRNTHGSIRRSVHRKHTWTGQYVNFNSFPPLKYKKGVVTTLFDRTRRI